MFDKYFNYPEDPHDPLWLVRFAAVGFAHVNHFYKDAYETSLSMSDYPIPPERTPIGGGDAQSPNDLWPNETNPFACAWKLTLMVDNFLQRLKTLKQRGEAWFGVTWQQIPLHYRQAINNMLELAEELRESGAWSVTDLNMEEKNSFPTVGKISW